MHRIMFGRVKSLAAATAAVLLSLTMTMSGQGAADQSKAGTWTAPRTPDGHPDLQGVWSYATAIPLERPDPAAPSWVTEAEAEADSVVGNYDATVWFEIGAKGNRPSLIVDPPDGRIPPLTPEAARRRQALIEERRGLAREEPTRGGWIESLGPTQLKVRCILGFNSGPPMTPGGYNQHVQIFQVPGLVALAPEMIHDARIVPMDGRPHGKLRQWLGDSRGRWEGDTLVIDTINFKSPPLLAGEQPSADRRLVERFTRVDRDSMVYEFTVTDLAIWTKPFTARIPLTRTEQPMFEYACHEGNYGLPNILRGARAKEKAEEEAARKSGGVK